MVYMLKDVDYRNFLDTIDVPALIITGSRDNICVPRSLNICIRELNSRN